MFPRTLSEVRGARSSYRAGASRCIAEMERVLEWVVGLGEAAPFYPPHPGPWRNWKAFRRGAVLVLMALVAMWPAMHAGSLGTGDGLVENPVLRTVTGLG